MHKIGRTLTFDPIKLDRCTRGQTGFFGGLLIDRYRSQVCHMAVHVPEMCQTCLQLCDRPETYPYQSGTPQKTQFVPLYIYLAEMDQKLECDQFCT